MVLYFTYYFQKIRDNFLKKYHDVQKWSEYSALLLYYYYFIIMPYSIRVAH